MRLHHLLSLVLVLACNGKSDPLQSTDIRIDAAGEGDSIDSSDVRMCINSEGQVFVVWSDDRTGVPAIWLNRSLDAGRTWMSVPVRVSGNDAPAIAPDLACLGNMVHVVWEDQRDGVLDNHNIYYARSADRGATWSSDQILLETDEDGQTMSHGPRVVAAGDEVHVAWFDSGAGSYDIYVASSKTRGTSFAEPVRVDDDAPGSSYSSWPRIDADGEGHVYVAWEDSRDGLSDIYFALSEDSGASYGENVRLDGGDTEGSANSFSPQLSVEGEVIYVVWHDTRNGDNADILYNFSEDYGVTWPASARRLDSDEKGAADSTWPALVVHGGVAHVAWQDDRNGGYDIFYRSMDHGLPEADEVRLDKDGEGFGNSLQPRIAVGESGMVVAWEDRRDDDEDAGYNDLYYNWSTDGGLTWDGEDRRLDAFEPGTKYAVDLDIAMYGGEVLGTWVDGRNGTADIYFQYVTLGESASYVTED